MGHCGGKLWFYCQTKYIHELIKKGIEKQGCLYNNIIVHKMGFSPFFSIKCEVMQCNIIWMDLDLAEHYNNDPNDIARVLNSVCSVFWPLLLFLCSSLCNGLSSIPRSPACVPLSCLWALFPLLNSWGGCDFTPGQHSLKGQDCQDLPCGEHDGHHAWLSGGGQWEPGPGTWCSEPTSIATEPGTHLYSYWESFR